LQIVGVAGSRLDPANFLEGFGSGKDIAGTQWENSAYSELISAARAACSTEDRIRILASAEDLLLTEAPVAPVFFGRVQQFVHPRVVGWRHNPLNVWSLREVAFR
jgi:ABC-type oligopeptide transport system substrate-binding subunit